MSGKLVVVVIACNMHASNLPVTEVEASSLLDEMTLQDVEALLGDDVKTLVLEVDGDINGVL